MRLFGKLQPAPVLARGERLAFSSKLTRLADRMKQPEWRRYAKLLIAGKLLGLAALFAIMLTIQIAPNILGGLTGPPRAVFATNAHTPPRAKIPGRSGARRAKSAPRGGRAPRRRSRRSAGRSVRRR